VLAKAGGGSMTLAPRQGKRDAVGKALATVADPKADPTAQLELLQVFGEVNLPECVTVVLDLLQRTNDLNLQMAAFTALQRYDEPRVGAQIVVLYPKLTEDGRAAAETLLLSRKSWTRELLETVDAGRINRSLLPLDSVRKATIHRDDRIAELIAKHWPNLKGASTAEMQAEITRLGQVLRGGDSDPYKGKELFTKTCAKCHTFFSEGGKIGPDLTAYKRDDALNILLNVINPSAEIREGFETFLALTDDGRAVTGFLADRDNRVVVLRGVDGQNITLERDHVEEMQAQKTSLMPEGLLRDLNDQQVRDLFAYLRSSQPLNK
jgi:putative heme-binding domain-containing protein